MIGPAHCINDLPWRMCVDAVARRIQTAKKESVAMSLIESQLKAEVEVAVEAVREAAVICTAVQAGIDKNKLEKKDRSPVTVADFGSQALICRTIKAAFPADPIIAEEDSAALKEPGNEEILANLTKQVQVVRSGVDADEICRWIDLGGESEYKARLWTLDPIDGTKGFLRGDQYAIALALIIEGELAAAVLGCPNLSFESNDKSAGGAGFFAVRGQGAFAIPLKGDAAPKPISVSDITDPALIRFCESVEAAHSSHSDAAKIANHLGITADPVRIDSQAKYGIVSRGEGDAYLRLPRDEVYREKIWDHAAGALIVSEAGGKVTDIRGDALDFTLGRKLENNKGIIATNGHVHDRVIDAIAKLGIAGK